MLVTKNVSRRISPLASLLVIYSSYKQLQNKLLANTIYLSLVQDQ